MDEIERDTVDALVYLLNQWNKSYISVFCFHRSWLHLHDPKEVGGFGLTSPGLSGHDSEDEQLVLIS